jgi:hypothetical protein
MGREVKALLLLLPLAALLAAGCGAGSRVEPGAASALRDPKEPRPRPVHWRVTPTAPLRVGTRTVAIDLPGYAQGLVVSVTSDANGDGLADVEATATRSGDGAPQRILLYGGRQLRSGSLRAAVARHDARVVPNIGGPTLKYGGDLTSRSLATIDTDRASTFYDCGADGGCGHSYTAVRVSVPPLVDLGGGWRQLAPRPPQYPSGAVWDVGDWSRDHRTDFLAATIAGIEVVAPTAAGVRVLPLPQLEIPAGQGMAFPVGVDLNGDGRSEVVGFGHHGSTLALMVVASA